MPLSNISNRQIYNTILKAINRANANIVTYENGVVVESIPTDEQIAKEVLHALLPRIQAWQI